MDEYTYKLFIDAKNSDDIDFMANLYDVNKNDTYIKLEYARMLIKRNQMSFGRSLLLEVLDSKYERDKNYALLELAKLELFQGDYETATKYLMKLLCSSMENDRIFAMFELGKIAILQHDNEEAKDCFLEIIEHEDENNKTYPYTRNKSYALLELGRSYEKIGNYEEARSCFNKLLQYGTEKDKCFACVELGKLSKLEKKYSEAESYFELFLNSKFKKERIMARFHLGQLKALQGKYDEAETYFKEILSYNTIKDKKDALRLLILLGIKKKDYDMSLKYLEIAKKLNIDIDYKIILYISKQLNIFIKNAYLNRPLNYSEKQVISYDPYLAIENIIENQNIEDNTVFNKNIDVYKAFNDVKKYLTEEYKTSDFSFNDKYLISYDNIGANGENYLKVVTLLDSKEIVSMYPVKRDENCVNFVRKNSLQR